MGYQDAAKGRIKLAKALSRTKFSISVAPNCPDPQVHSPTSPKTLHFRPSLPHIHSLRSLKALREYPKSTRRKRTKPLMQNTFRAGQLFKFSSAFLSNPQGRASGAAVLFCELTQSQYNANMATERFMKGANGARGC